MNEEKVSIFYSEEMIKDYLKRVRKENNIKEDIKISNIQIDKSVNVNYQYKITRAIKCDGTFVFIKELIDSIIINMINCETHYKPTFPHDKVDELKSVNYTIGDFELYVENVEGTKEKPWLTTRWIVSLPVNCEYVFA